MAAQASAPLHPSFNALVHLTQLDPDGETVESSEVWRELSEKELNVLRLAELEKGRWDERLFDRFAALRTRRFDPTRSAKGVVIDEEFNVVIHYDNDDIVDESEEEEEEEEEDARVVLGKRK
jgi:hypothetical protein